METSFGPPGRSAKAPETPAPAVATLEEVIRRCLMADPLLRAGIESVNQARADALTASLKPNPTLSIDQTLLPLTHAFTEERQGGPP